MQGASYDRVYEIYVVTFWLRSAQARDPQCTAGWEKSSFGGREYKAPRIDSYVNDVDELCAWYEPSSKKEEDSEEADWEEDNVEEGDLEEVESEVDELRL